jgi:RNA polymerase sigma factor (sigma-70 family)
MAESEDKGRGRAPVPAQPQALRQVLAARPFLMAFLVSLLRDFALAEEIFKDLCVAAGEARAEPPGPDPDAWARRAARQRAFALLRARAASGLRVPPEELVDRIEQAIVELAAAEQRWARRKQALRECFRALPSHLRQVLELHYGRGLPAGKIGSQLKLEAQAVCETLARARAQLEEDLRRRAAQEGAP